MYMEERMKGKGVSKQEDTEVGLKIKKEKIKSKRRKKKRRKDVDGEKKDREGVSKREETQKLD